MPYLLLQYYDILYSYLKLNFHSKIISLFSKQAADECCHYIEYFTDFVRSSIDIALI